MLKGQLTPDFLDAQGQLIQQSESDLVEIRAHSSFMYFIFTCKNKDDPIKNEGTRIIAAIYIDFF